MLKIKLFVTLTPNNLDCSHELYMMSSQIHMLKYLMEQSSLNIFCVKKLIITMQTLLREMHVWIQCGYKIVLLTADWLKIRF